MQQVTHQLRGTNKSAILAIILVSYVMIVLDISIVLTGLPKIHAELGFHRCGPVVGIDGLYARIRRIPASRRAGRGHIGKAAHAARRSRRIRPGIARHRPCRDPGGHDRCARCTGPRIGDPRPVLALLQTNFEPGPERTRAVSYYAAAAGVSAAVGLVVGGLLADWLSWRVGFFINLPIGIAMMLAAGRYVAETEKSPARFDILGAIASTIAMVSLVYGVIRSASSGWDDPVTISAVAVGVVMMAVFVIVESRAAEPIMPLALFADGERVAAYAGRALFLGANVGFYFFVAQYLQSVAGLSPAAAGITFLPTTVVNFAAAMCAPTLIGRFGSGPVLTGSVMAGLVGMGWLSAAIEGSSIWTLVLPMMLVGAGQGGALGPLTASGIVRVPLDRAGAASGVVNVSHQLGSSLGLGILVAASVFGSDGLSGTALLAHRAAIAMEAATVLIGLTLVLVLAFIVRPRAETASDLANLEREA